MRIDFLSTGFQIALGPREETVAVGCSSCGVDGGAGDCWIDCRRVGSLPPLRRTSLTARGSLAGGAPQSVVLPQSGRLLAVRRRRGAAPCSPRPRRLSPGRRLLPRQTMAAPDAFSDELAWWVSNKCTKSIVFVELRPKKRARVKGLLDLVSPINEDQDAEEKHATRLKECEDYQCCTGFVINDTGGLKILTCAHVVGPIFNNQYPINPKTVNHLYNPFILCIHQEDRFQKREARHRIYMRAQVVQISGLMDLMVLQVSEQELNKCHHPHPGLVFAAEFPERPERVVMLSWPPGAERTEVIGAIAHRSQSFNNISATNPRGYSMRLSQVSLMSETGSSGAPLLNGRGEYSGVLQSGNNRFSFFVSFDDLKTMLQLWNLI